MALSDAERLFLAREWRFVETNDPDIKARFPGALEADYSSFFINIDGATAVLAIIHAAVSADNRLLTAVVPDIIPLSFRVKPPTVNVLINRFGFSEGLGRLMRCERGDLDYTERTTTLYLLG